MRENIDDHDENRRPKKRKKRFLPWIHADESPTLETRGNIQFIIQETSQRPFDKDPYALPDHVRVPHSEWDPIQFDNHHERQQLEEFLREINGSQ